MPTTYASSSDGLFLQSVTEQKHQGGLFTVSAEYRRISGNLALPETIPTSVGNVDVYPEPTITIGTDGFERVNATGYDIWSNNTAKTVSLQVGELDLIVFGWKRKSFVAGDPVLDGSFEQVVIFSKVKGYLFESIHQIKMRTSGDNSILSAPALRVLNFAGGEVTEYSHYGADPVAIVKSSTLTNIKVTSFGTVEQIEVVHSIISAIATVSLPDPNV